MSWRTLLSLTRFWSDDRIEQNSLHWFDSLSFDDRVTAMQNLPALELDGVHAKGVRAVQCVLHQRKRTFPPVVLRAFLRSVGDEVREALMDTDLEHTLQMSEQMQLQEEKRLADAALQVERSPKKRQRGAESQDERDNSFSLSLDEEDKAAPLAFDSQAIHSQTGGFDSQRQDGDDNENDGEGEEVAGRSSQRQHFGSNASQSAAADAPERAADIWENASSTALTAADVAFLSVSANVDALKAACLSQSDESVRNLLMKCSTALGTRSFGDVLQCALVPRLLALNKAASRVTMSTILDCGKANGKVLVDCVLVRLLIAEEGEEGAAVATAPQCDIVIRCISDLLDLPLSLRLFQSLVAQSFSWSEHVIGVFAKLVVLDFADEEQQKALHEKFVTRLEENVASFASNVKFGKLVQTFLQTHGTKQAVATLDALMNVAEQLKTFMKKACLDAVQKARK